MKAATANGAVVARGSRRMQHRELRRRHDQVGGRELTWPPTAELDRFDTESLIEATSHGRPRWRPELAQLEPSANGAVAAAAESPGNSADLPPHLDGRDVQPGIVRDPADEPIVPDGPESPMSILVCRETAAGVGLTDVALGWGRRLADHRPTAPRKRQKDDDRRVVPANERAGR